MTTRLQSFAPDRWVRPAHQYVVDALIWAIAIPLATMLRYDLDSSKVSWGGVFATVVLAVVWQGCVGWAAGLYRRQWRYGSFEELIGLAITLLVVGAGLSAIVWTPAATIPRSVPILAGGLTVTGTIVVRSIRRLQLGRRIVPGQAEPIVVVGAGSAAYEIVRTLLASRDCPYRPVALVDDDPMKSNLRMHGARVEGVVEDLVSVVHKHHATAVLLAIPTAEPELVRLVDDLARRAGVRLLVLPAVRDLFTAPALSDIRPVSDADLLGRLSADIDTAAVAQYVTDRRVLVTGAGGSIGSELCRQLARFEPSQLIMLDRDESGLHGTQLSIEGRALLDTPNLVLADIRDARRLRQVFAELRPQVVFHAAALKHLTLLEQAPHEAWKTNVFGTQNVIDAARSVGVEHFVNISTDKAADPTSVLGSSKRITERLTADAANDVNGQYTSVRFGNVLGSRGSVLTTFRAQAEGGGPITVTHADVTRFFMTVQEAVRLTIYAGAIGHSGEVLVLDMGEPVKIVDVAKRFARQHSPELEIVFTGLRPGEKLHEDLFGLSESDRRPIHPLISHVPVPPLSFDVVVEADGWMADVSGDLISRLATDRIRRRVVA